MSKDRQVRHCNYSHFNVSIAPVLNFCANNYLGLSTHPSVIRQSHAYLDSHGAGLSSVRFICGTQDIHQKLEQTITKFHGTEDTILYASCFDANAGIFEALLNDQDAIISDALNHASIIDGVRLCKAKRFRYKNANMHDLELQLKQARDVDKSRTIMIATDGVFSMDGRLAPLDKICDLAEKYGALVFVDDCHATGFLGHTGKGTPEHFGVSDRVDIVNSTLGKALGGASGGYTTGSKEVVSMLRQKSRPYLFSNSLPPAVVGAAQAAFDIVSSDEGEKLRNQLFENMRLFYTEMTRAGFTLQSTEHPIVPIMLKDARLSSEFADKMLKKGIYVVGFSFPVVPRGEARIRVQLSGGHSTEQVKAAIKAFIEVGADLGVVALIKSKF